MPEAIFHVDAVAFDLDGTLLDTIHDLASAVNDLLAAEGMRELPQTVVRDLVGKGVANLLDRAVTLARGTVPTTTEAADLLERYLALYGERIGRETRLYPGVVEGLERMRAAGFGLAVVTNKATRFVRPHLDHAGITHYFAAIVGGDDAVRKKPDPAPIELAASLLGVRPDRMLMVGDSGNDVAAARAAGSPVLLLPYGYSEGLPVQSLGSDGIVDSLLAVADRVRRSQHQTT